MIVVTGVGRSGTSLIAALYQELGFDIGGGWVPSINAGLEAPDVVEANERLMADLGLFGSRSHGRAPGGEATTQTVRLRRADRTGAGTRRGRTAPAPTQRPSPPALGADGSCRPRAGCALAAPQLGATGREGPALPVHARSVAPGGRGHRPRPGVAPGSQRGDEEQGRRGLRRGAIELSSSGTGSCTDRGYLRRDPHARRCVQPRALPRLPQAARGPVRGDAVPEPRRTGGVPGGVRADRSTRYGPPTDRCAAATRGVRRTSASRSSSPRSSRALRTTHPRQSIPPRRVHRSRRSAARTGATIHPAASA